MKRQNIKKSQLLVGSIIGGIIVVAIVIMGSSQSSQRMVKDMLSDYRGGLNRTITVYDYSGKQLEQYTGKFDVEYKPDGSVKFDIDGKRTVITGGIIINQEN